MRQAQKSKEKNAKNSKEELINETVESESEGGLVQ